MKKKILSLFALCITLITIFSFGFATNVNAAFNGTRWTTRPITFYATNQLNANQIAALKSAMAEWNSIGKGTFFTYGGQLNSSIVAVDGKNVVGKAAIFSVEIVAMTNLQYNTSTHITAEADISLNSNINLNRYNMKTVFMHELGHVLGLADTEETNSIMHKNYENNAGKITSYDIADINKLY